MRAATLVLLIAAVLCVGQDVALDADPPRGVFAEKLGAAFLGEVAVGAVVTVGMFGIGLASGVEFHTADGLPWLLGGMAVAAVGIPAGTAAGTCIVGHGGRQDGRFWASYLGGLAGVPIGYGLAALGSGCPLYGSAPLLVAGALSPAFCSVVGYNLSRSAENRTGFWTERVQPPGFTVCAVECPAGRLHTELDCRLLTVRF